MTESYANVWLNKLELRHNEIDKLIDLAKIHQEKDESAFNAICRSATVMLYAHFEGSLRSAIKSFSDDMNKNGGYSIVGERIKSLFLCGLLDIEISVDNLNKSLDRRRRLDAKLDGSSGININLEHVWLNGKNPTADIYRTVIMRFGIDNIFKILEDSEMEISMFTEGILALSEKINVLIDRFRENYSVYPYTSIFAEIGCAEISKHRKKTITEEFINNTMRPRHDIAHGHTLENILSLDQVEAASIRMKFLSIIFYAAITENNPTV